MKRVAIVQARMDSQRLPGKVLMDVGGRPMLEQQLRRLGLCSEVDLIAVATTDRSVDDEIVTLCKRLAVPVIRGALHDVLGRYVQATVHFAPDLVIRITGDCPLIDPEVTDAVIAGLLAEPAIDYASNVLARTYPHGLDVEAMFADVILRISRLATSAADREHVTSLLRFGHPELFSTRSIMDDIDNSDLRWTVDTEQDLAMVRLLFESLELSTNRTGYRQLVAFVRSNPAIAEINAATARAFPADRGFADGGAR